MIAAGHTAPHPPPDHKGAHTVSVSILRFAHIDVLVAAGKQFGVLADSGEAVETGQLLADVNLTAYLAAGPDDGAPAPDGRPYYFTQPHGILDPIAVLKAADCYSYQVLTKVPGPMAGLAVEYLRALRLAVVTATDSLLLEPPRGAQEPAYRLLAAYARAPWEITDSVQATRAAMGPHPHDGTH